MTVLDEALSEFLARNELSLKNSAQSLLISDAPLRILQQWQGSVLTAHRGINHPRVITTLPVDFRTDEVFVCLSPLSDIARWQIDTALAVTTGTIMALAENRRGAERLASLVGKEQHPSMESFARSHCRAVRATHHSTLPLSHPLPHLIPHPVQGWEEMEALPGVFSSERADRGSEVLKGCALERVSSWNNQPKAVLDLGCGSGILGISVLERNRITLVDFVDVDYRAIESTKGNLTHRSLPTDRVFWLDATREPLPRSGYDLVLLNPPFHAHGQEHRELGRTLIEKAMEVTSGELLVVGNTHLGYDAFLHRTGWRVEVFVANSQFTVWSARKG